MGNGDINKPTKDTKESKESKVPTSQEQTSSANTNNVNPEWSGFQAYSPIPPHGFLASNPQAHPYMWGVQHLMPPYGTPPHPYVAMYPHPHGGIYTHPSIPPGSYPFGPYAMPSPNGVTEVSGNTPSSMEVDGKPFEGKEKLPIKRSKGSLVSLNMITGKNSEPGKTSGTSANGVSSKRIWCRGRLLVKDVNQGVCTFWIHKSLLLLIVLVLQMLSSCIVSAESASDASSEGSDASSQNDSQVKAHRHDSLQGEAFQNGNASHRPQNGGPNASNSMLNPTMTIVPVSTTGAPGCIPGPTTNLNIGMDYWGTTTSSTVPATHGKVPSAPVAGGMVTAGSGDSVQSQLWLQDERELKKQRRKQSNRESARRSRLRKQAEYDELAVRAEALKEENGTLRAELNRIRSEYDQLVGHNASLRERLGEVPGQEDPRSSQTDQQTDNHAPQSGQPDSSRTGS